MVHLAGKWRALPAILAIVAISPEAAAYCRTTTCAVVGAPANCTRDPVTGCHAFGAPLFWEQSCVAFSVHERGSPKLGLDFAGTEALVSSAFAAWPNAGCGTGFPSIAIVNFGPTFCDRAEFNSSGPNSSAVIFRDASWSHDATQLALTTVTFDRETGKIFGADIEVNTFGYSLTTAQAQFTVTHEAGHFLGLDHSQDPAALMSASYDLFAPPFLTPDDVAGICAAYPPGRHQAECDAEPEHGFATDCGGNVEGSCATVPRPGALTLAAAVCMFAALFAAAQRRMRRRSHR
jgi:hypothetical protein